jgi:hypothetical protein
MPDIPVDKSAESIADEMDVPEDADAGQAQQPIDLQALAEKVFALMQQELRIERERMGRRY